ncbi:MAG: hypothetical protein ACOYBC_08545 [Bilifractor sp.]|jgi:hypothetical protein
MKFLQNLEKKIGKYAISHLTLYIIGTYVIGYILYFIQRAQGVPILGYLSLDPGKIAQGQIWRIVSWLLIPPSSFDIWTIVMLICYYQLGTMLERAWGDFLYNFYIFFGMIMTVIGTCIMYAVYPFFRQVVTVSTQYGGSVVTTYYVSLSIFLGFAMTFPDQVMLFMFIIPVKIKYLAILDVVYLVYSVIVSPYHIITLVLILCSLASTIIFFFMSRSYRRSGFKHQKEKRRQFREAYSGRSAGPYATSRGHQNSSGAGNHTKIAIHRCAVCGRTELDDPNLEFRFCSKCKGNYEYCSDHLYNHKHVE